MGPMTAEERPEFTFRLLVDDDLELMHTWLNEPGVVRWWEGDDVTPNGVWSTYSPNRPGALAGTDSTENWLGLIDGEPTGWICCWPVLEGLEESKPWFPLGVEETAAGIDYLVGAPVERGKGIGSAMIRSFALDIVFGQHPWFTQAAAGPYTENVASCRALEKAGFIFRGSVTHPGEAHNPCSLMVMDRPEYEEPAEEPDDEPADEPAEDGA